jgi:hypothetical protein
MIGAMAIRLIPLIDFTLWGSDWGEYYILTQDLVDSGSHVEVNPGWGKAYVDFPGLFDLAGGFALVTGISVATTMTLVIPCVMAASCLLVACLVLKLGGGPWGALFAASVLAVIFPEVYANSHPVPGPLGSVLVMAIMLVFFIGDRWRRDEDMDAKRPLILYLLFILLISALAVTHHLSLFFVIIVLGAAYLVRMSLVHGTEDERSTWGLASFAIAMAAATFYWLVIATTFRDSVMNDLFSIPGQLVIGAAWFGVIVMVLLGLWLRGRRSSVPDILYWGTGLLRATVLAFLVCGVVIIGLVAVLGVPGTGIQPGSGMAIYTIPVVVAFAVGVGSTDVILRKHGGHVIIGWVLALVVSFLFAVAIRSEVLVPYRHLPYIVEASVVLLGIGIIHLRRMTLPEGRAFSRATGVAATLLIVVLMATAYPPKEVMAGFQEGTNQHEVEASIWLQNGLPRPGAIVDDKSSGAVVTDHRLSSMSFGIGGKMATWDQGGDVLYGGKDTATLKALADVETPYGDRPVAAVVLSEDFRTGAALSQYESAEPIEGEAWDKFFEPPFVRLYDGGDVWVFGVPQPITSWS